MLAIDKNELLTGEKTQSDFVINACDILTNEYPEPVWILPDIFPAGLNILSGRPKVGKSWLIMQIACAVSSGNMMFDRKIDKGKVLLLMLEDFPRRLQGRMVDQGWTNDYAKNIDFLTMKQYRERIGLLHKQGWKNLIELALSKEYRFIAIDTFSRAFAGIKDPNNSPEVNDALSPLQEAAGRNNIGLLISDHQTRGYTGDPIDDIWQSTAKAAVADNGIGLYRNKAGKGFILNARGRDVGDFECALEFNPNTHCYKITENHQLPTRQDEVHQTIKTLKKCELSDITRLTGIQKPHACKYANELIQLGYIAKEMIGNRVFYSPSSNQ
jgi:hypothetical protein